MMVHVRYVPKCSEGNPGLSEDSVEFCVSGGLLRVHPNLTMSHIG